MQLDPFEKQFDFPTPTIKVGEALRRQAGIVDRLLVLGILDVDQAHTNINAGPIQCAC